MPHLAVASDFPTRWHRAGMLRASVRVFTYKRLSANLNVASPQLDPLLLSPGTRWKDGPA